MAGRRSWSFKHERRVIELAKASKSLEEAARIMVLHRAHTQSFNAAVKFKSDAKKD
jgi:hypothetical protein